MLQNIFWVHLSSEIGNFHFLGPTKTFCSLDLPCTSCPKTFWKRKFENFHFRSSDELKKYSAALGRCGIRFLIDWWRFQIDLGTLTIPKAQKHYFLIKFTCQNFRKIMDFLLFQILNCDCERLKIIFRISSCHERFLRGSNKSNIGSKYFFQHFSIFLLIFEKRCRLGRGRNLDLVSAFSKWTLNLLKAAELVYKIIKRLPEKKYV